MVVAYPRNQCLFLPPGLKLPVAFWEPERVCVLEPAGAGEKEAIDVLATWSLLLVDAPPCCCCCCRWALWDIEEEGDMACDETAERASGVRRPPK